MQTTKYIVFLFLIISIIYVQPAQAVDVDFKWSEIRFFISNNNFSDDNTALNSLTTADNVEKLKSLAGFGLEVDARLKPWLKVGTRIKGIFNAVKAPEPAQAYTQLSQYTAGLLARIPIVDNSSVLFDVFTEVGLANTTLEVKTTSSGTGEFSKEGGVFGRAGASVGFGWESGKIFVEGGQEWNKLDGLSFKGNLVNNVSSVDLSGTYVSVGVIISGIPSWIKPGGISSGK